MAVAATCRLFCGSACSLQSLAKADANRHVDLWRALPLQPSIPVTEVKIPLPSLSYVKEAQPQSLKHCVRKRRITR